MGEIIEFDGNVRLHFMLWAAGIAVYQIETDKPMPGFKKGEYHVVMTPIEEERDMGPSWDDAPDWAICKTQSENGTWKFHEFIPFASTCFWSSQHWKIAFQTRSNPNWRDTLEMRPEQEQDEQPSLCDTISVSTSQETMDLLRFRISTETIETMVISEDLISISGEEATPDEVVAFLKRLAERNAKDALR